MKKRKRKKIIFVLGVFILLILIGLGGLKYYFSELGKPYLPNSKEIVEIEIAQGTNSRKIAEHLENAGVIKDSRQFIFYLKKNDLENSLKSGFYRLSPAMSLKEITERLSKGGSVPYDVLTIPEGFTLEQIVDKTASLGLATEDELWNVLNNHEFPQFDFLPPLGTNNRLEGYLFPDTYHIGRDSSADQIVSTMLSRFSQIKEELPLNKTDLSFKDVIILASIVEKEAVAAKERAVIASAFLNRLAVNQRLESCATLQYVLPEHKERLLLSDLEFKSPYNTYRNDGLPPGPICNPGRQAIIAVLEPANTSYKYFVAKNDGTGEHLFAETYSGHLANRRKLGY